MITIEQVKADIHKILDAYDTKGISLFREWCGNSYEWDALLDVEKQRWNRLAEKGNPINLTPVMAKALLVAIEGLELIHEQTPLGEYAAWDTIETICRTWEESK